MHNLCNCPTCQTNDCPAAAELEALTKERDELEDVRKEAVEVILARNKAIDQLCTQNEALTKEVERLKQLHTTDMRVTNESADFHMKRCDQLRTQNRELRECLTEARYLIAQIGTTGVERTDIIKKADKWIVELARIKEVEG